MPNKIFKIVILNLFFLTSSCGFQVIYKENSNIASYAKELASVRIQKGRTILSQKLKNNLYDVLNPDNLDEEAKYFLTLNITSNESATFITSTGASGRNKITLRVSYSLKNLKNAALISTGETSANDNFDITNNRYGTYEAQQYIESNLAKTIVLNIRNLIVNDLIETKKKCNDETLKDSLTFTCPL